MKPQILCSNIEHKFGSDIAGNWHETYTDAATDAVLFTQPIAPWKPSTTPPAQVGAENGWCRPTLPVANPITESIDISSLQQNTEPPPPTTGMGSFFLLVVLTTGGIALFQRFQAQQQPPVPQFEPSPWETLYMDHIERRYPPLPEERPGAETLQTMGQAAIQTSPKPDSNQPLNQIQTSPKPDSNQPLNRIQTVPNFDPTQPESQGEFETYQLLLTINQWSPRGKEILRALWQANPNTKRYEPAIERRNQFANRIQEHQFNG